MGHVRRGLTTLILLAIVVATGGTALAAPPPAAPTITSKPAAFVNTTTATFTWTHANTSATFACSLDGAKAKTCTSPTSYTGLAAGAHKFTVRAVVSGSKNGRLATVNWTIDLTAPNTPTLSQPTTPTTSQSASLSFGSSSTDVASFQCSLDGATFATCTSPRALSSLAEGFHTFAVKAVDNAGNVSGTKSVLWKIDRSAATPVITSAPPTISTGSVSFGFASTDTDVTFSCSMDSTTTYTACTSPKSYTGLSNASHTFRVRATDTLGNISTPAAYTWTVQAVPVISLAWSNPGGLPAPVTSLTSGTFAFTASGQSTLTCRLDGVDQASCVSPQSVSSLSDGAHTYAVVANAGLGSQVTLTYTWVVDTVAPSAPTITGPAPRTGATSANIVVQPGSPNDAVACTVDNVAQVCTAPIVLSGLSEGDHNVKATASDAAGNSAQAQLDWTIDLTGPDATTAAPTALTGPFVVTFDEDTTGVDSSSVQLATETGTPLASKQTCLTAADAVTDCGNSDVRTVRLVGSSKLVLGQYYRVQVNPVGAASVTDDVSNVATSVDDVVRAPTTAGESSLGATFTWRKVADRKAAGGSFFAEHRKGARASWTFSGKSVAWLTVAGPTYGKADVYIDGARKATVNNYAKNVKHGVTRAVKGLAKGTHTIEIRVLGKKGAKAGKGTFVAIDGFTVGKAVTATPALTKVGWQKGTNVAASDKTFVAADLKGQTMKTVVRGTSVRVFGVRGPTYGKAGLYLDGKLVKTVDLYAKAAKWGSVAAVTGLTDATHTVVVKVLGSKNAKSAGTAVVVDGLSVG